MNHPSQKILCLFFMLLLFGAAHAGTLTGTIRDAKGAPLGYATVYVAGTTAGTAANASGAYTIQLPAGTYVVTCTYIGYAQTTYTLTIGESETLHHDFRLTPQSLEMKEVVVRSSDEDPAYRIIREAIKRRSFHLGQVKDFQTGIYLKGVLRTSKIPDKIFFQKINDEDKKGDGFDSAGRGVIYLCEEVADYYAQQPAKQKTVIHSVRESGNPNGFGFSTLPPVITFYENNVDIGSGISSRGHISPIASDALAHYKYRLEGEFKEGEHTIYKIRVTPKRVFEPLFFGTLYIVDGDWAIHSLSLATSKRYGLEMLDTLHLTQQYLPLKKDVWVIKTQQFYVAISIFGLGINGGFVTVYDRQKVNESVPDSIFSEKVISTYDKTANKKDSSYWNTIRPIGLEADEQRDYHRKDSVRAVAVDPHRLDSLRRRANRIGLGSVLLSGITKTDSGYRNRLEISALIASVNYNSVEGLVLEPQITWNHRIDTPNRLELRIAPRYGFSNTHFNTEAALTYSHTDPHWRGRNWALVADGGRYVYQYNRENPVTSIFNAFTTLVLDYNELKIYERWTAALAYRRSTGTGFSYRARIAYEHRIPLQNVDYYSFSGDGRDKFTDNLPDNLKAWHYEEHDALWVRLSASWRPGFHYIMYPDYKQPVGSSWPTFSLQYDRGIPDLLGSKIDWDKWRAGINGSFGLRRLGSVDYVLSGGGFITRKYVGIPDLNHLFAGDDAVFTLASPYLRAFQLAPFYKFSNDAQFNGLANVEWNLNGFLTNKIPGLRQLNWYLILGGNAFYSSEKLYFAEAFASIDNIGFKIFRVLRFDYLHAWDSDHRSYDGFRIGLHIGALAALSGGTGDTEW